MFLRKNSLEDFSKLYSNSSKVEFFWKFEVFKTLLNSSKSLMFLLLFGIPKDLVSIDLAKLNNVDPTPVEVIENLKKELGGK